MDANSTLTIDYQPWKGGKTQVTVKFPDGSSYTDTINVGSAEQRTTFLEAVTNGRDGLQHEDKLVLAQHLEAIAAQRNSADATVKGAPRQADMLVELVQDAELFHTPGGHDSEGYATVEIHGHKETWAICGNGFRRWLGRQFFEKYGKALSPSDPGRYQCDRGQGDL